MGRPERSVTLALKARRDFRGANLELMADTLRKHGEALAAGRITPAEFDARAWAEVRAGSAAQFRFAFGGPLGKAQLEDLNDLLAGHRKYFDGFLTDIKGADDLGFVGNRASMYRAAGVQADSLGHLAAAGDTGTIHWRGPDGPSACSDCLRYIGSYTAAEFRALGATPGSTACLGRCRCHIEREG